LQLMTSSSAVRCGGRRIPLENMIRLQRGMPAKFYLSFLCPRLHGAVLAILLVLQCGCLATASGAPAKEQAGKLPMLTTARQAHSLSEVEAARGYPIHLQGVVTYFDPDFGYGNAAIFVHDSTGCVFVTIPSTKVGLLTAGTVIDVRGVSGRGTFGPIVTEPQIRVIGRASLPANPPRVSLLHLKTGAEDAQWIEVEGTVHAVSVYKQTVTLQLAMIDGTISAILPREAAATYSNLVDAKVRIRANAAPIINGDAQMIGVHLMVPNLSVVTIVEPAPGDPFRQPLTRIDMLLHWDELLASSHRVHLRGNVTLQWPDSSLCIRDANRGICVQTAQETRFALGDLVDIAGFAGTENDEPVLTDAVLRSTGKGAPVAAVPVSVEQALQGTHDSDLIQIEGQLIGDDMATSDLNLMLASGNTVFAVVLPKGLMGAEEIPWKVGSRLRVTGICSMQIDARSHLREGIAVIKSFRVLMRSPQDVVVLESPSWWTPGHVLVLLALALAVTLSVLGWVMVLRKRVAEQTVLLRKSEERFRHMALHDALTGLATRLLLDDRLTTAVEDARRHKTGLALLMIDIDKFKEVNDTFGHHGGDEVLRATADRLMEAVRKTDTVARMGGDEFVVLLPHMKDPIVAEGIAAKIVKSLATPVLYTGREIPISVSVGVCTSAMRGLDAEALLNSADDALYQAKAKGKNCFSVFTPSLNPSQTASIA